MKDFDVEKYLGMEINGFKWIHHYKGVHSFQKEVEPNLFCLVECSEDQLTNGDIQIMTEKGLTLSSERKRKIRSKYSE